MKKYIPILLFLAACNNSSEPAQSGSTATVAEEKKTSSGAGGCESLIFFRKGITVEATSYDAEGKETGKQLTTILDITSKDGNTIAHVRGEDIRSGTGEKKTLEYNYRCDGKNIYMDIASAFRTLEKNEDASFTSTEIEYPIDIKEGQSLPDVSGTMSAEKNGKKSTMTFQYKNRKVGSMETITTPAGTWKCYPVSNDVIMEMDIPGMNAQMKEMMKAMQDKMKTSTTTWFAPDFGIVKMEMYQDGKLKSRNEVTKVGK
ncbi:MAG: hypothetical protein JNN29_08570 [Chitinophagaceae bacterium]|nr:hypothetical protein [Chitinophagaceae bacterium]